MYKSLCDTAIRTNPELFAKAKALGYTITTSSTNKDPLLALLKSPKGVEILQQIMLLKPQITGVLDEKSEKYNKVDGLANRNWQQNIGDSDKGSIVAIQHLGEIDTVMSKAIEATIPAHKEKVMTGLVDYLKGDEIGKDDHPVLEYLHEKGFINNNRLEGIKTGSIKPGDIQPF